MIGAPSRTGRRALRPADAGTRGSFPLADIPPFAALNQ